jgi:flagellar motor switch protein FliN
LTELNEAANGQSAPDEAESSPRSAKLAKRAIPELDPEIFGDVSIELLASLGQGAMTVAELVGLKAGEVVPLRTPLNGLVELSLNGRIVARGEIVAVDDRFGVRVTEIVARKA